MKEYLKVIITLMVRENVLLTDITVTKVKRTAERNKEKRKGKHGPVTNTIFAAKFIV